MAIILLNVVTLKSSTLQLESVRLQCHSSLVLHMTDILTFSPDARFLTVFCYMENDESKYELMFYQISSVLSLKDLCRVVILERACAIAIAS